MHKEDILTHLGDDYERFMGSVTTPIFQSSLFVRSKGTCDYSYTRAANPTTEVAEKKIAALEEGEAARCFSSGMAAITSAILHCIKKDSHVVCINNVYGPTRAFLNTYLKKFGVEVTFVKGEDPDDFKKAIRPGTSMFYLESPSSHVFSMQDLEAVSKIAKENGILTVIDNSWATPLFQNPIKFGIDIVIHTASKYLGGHSDIVAGVVISSQKIIDDISNNERMLLGGIMDPHQSWLLIRGMRTLYVRVKQHMENAMKVAEFLESHDKIKKVIYPGLKSHPQYDLGRKQLSGYTGLLSFITDKSDENACEFIGNLKYFQTAPSWGGFESLVTGIGLNRTDEELKNMCLPKGLIRIHVGLENPDTLIEDLDRNL